MTKETSPVKPPDRATLPLKPKNVEDLIGLLKLYSIVTSNWNANLGGSVNDLWNEANKGDCFFIAYNGELKRIISVAAITVRYQNKVLCESKQVFVTGETNVRPNY